ncbi:hypothetical protein B0H14DRAFT_3440739 [Mycena olivaceomarginata]|nr:hypothetical protein B0H14DRAFT_3440739 [Mycena olivaceomarginata]
MSSKPRLPSPTPRAPIESAVAMSAGKAVREAKSKSPLVYQAECCPLGSEAVPCLSVKHGHTPYTTKVQSRWVQMEPSRCTHMKRNVSAPGTYVAARCSMQLISQLTTT